MAVKIDLDSIPWKLLLVDYTRTECLKAMIESQSYIHIK